MKLFTFMLNENLYGIEIKHIREIGRNIRYTQVPSVQPEIIGLYNMRGSVVSIFDLKHLLGFSRGKEQEMLTCIIMKPVGGEHIGFAIDKAYDVIDVKNLSSESLQGDEQSKLREKLLGVTYVENKTIHILDYEKIFTTDAL